MYKTIFKNLSLIFNSTPHAFAAIKGGTKYPKINGIVCFYRLNFGCLVAAQITDLPDSNLKCNSPVFGFHIHEGSSCSGDATDEFKNSLSHFNPLACPHPHHAGEKIACSKIKKGKP